MTDVTQILSEIEHGDPAAADQLLALVYGELRRLAAQRLAREKPGQTLQATGLVHEAYLRLVGGNGENRRWENRGHFFAAAAEAMRRILIEAARRKGRLKRQNDGVRLQFSEADFAIAERSQDLLALDEALDRLATIEGASFSDITAAQLYSSASYQAHDLSGLKLSGNYAGLNFAGQNLTSADLHRANLTNANLSQANLTGADFTDHIDAYRTGPSPVLTGANLSGANLTNADFSGYSYSFPTEDGEVIVVVYGADLTGVNISGADARGANFQYDPLPLVYTSNFIQSNGHIAGLDLTAGALLVVRNYHGAAAPKIVVDQHLAMGTGGTLRLVFDADAWNSTISFAPGIPVTPGGTLELTFAPDVTLAGQLGRTFDLFDWTGVNPTGTFTVASPYVCCHRASITGHL